MDVLTDAPRKMLLEWVGKPYISLPGKGFGTTME
jgi:hypothetical protein